MYQHFPIYVPSKLTQIGIFGLKINHLATLIRGRFSELKFRIENANLKALGRPTETLHRVESVPATRIKKNRENVEKVSKKCRK
jgi:hypothetical protein